ncbi:MAG: hypothetical protein C0515_04480 [Novosphingobium sp.]|nr:hypothetical protein [Novosphingobium sp.]
MSWKASNPLFCIRLRNRCLRCSTDSWLKNGPIASSAIRSEKLISSALVPPTMAKNCWTLSITCSTGIAISSKSSNSASAKAVRKRN